MKLDLTTIISFVALTSSGVLLYIIIRMKRQIKDLLITLGMDDETNDIRHDVLASSNIEYLNEMFHYAQSDLNSFDVQVKLSETSDSVRKMLLIQAQSVQMTQEQFVISKRDELNNTILLIKQRIAEIVKL